MKDKSLNPKPMFYACVLESLRKIAKENGYALAIHGSCASDLDLIAVRWNNEFSTPNELVRCLLNELSNYAFGKVRFTELTTPEHRYNNQIHYIIPIISDWYIDLTVIEENAESKKKYENAVADYETTMAEKEQLKKQLEDANEKILLLQASEPMLNYKKSLEETQQKAFIKYLEDEIKLYENDIQTFSKNYNVYFSLINDLKVGKARTEDILQKYKSIIGVSDENND